MSEPGKKGASISTPHAFDDLDSDRISLEGGAPPSGDSDSTSQDSGSSGSDAPFPSHLLESIDDRNCPAVNGTTLVNRLKRAFHLDGVDTGRIPQRIHSLAAIEDLDSDFLIFRKFGWLRNYALLHLQDELVDLQHKLEILDDWEYRDGDFKNLLCRRNDHIQNNSGRKQLVEEIHNKLAQYDAACLRAQNIQSLKRPTERAQRNLYHLVLNTGSLVADEAHWTAEGPDLAALGRGPEYGWLNPFIADMLSKISKKATRMLFQTEEQKIKTGSENLELLAADRLDVLVRIFLTLVAAVLLLIPVAVLFKLQPTSPADFQRKSNYQIVTVFLFTLLFSGSCSIFTKARRREVFAATAAYSAILVVFLGNSSQVVGS